MVSRRSETRRDSSNISSSRRRSTASASSSAGFAKATPLPPDSARKKLADDFPPNSSGCRKSGWVYPSSAAWLSRAQSARRRPACCEREGSHRYVRAPSRDPGLRGRRARGTSSDRRGDGYRRSLAAATTRCTPAASTRRRKPAAHSPPRNARQARRCARSPPETEPGFVPCAQPEAHHSFAAAGLHQVEHVSDKRLPQKQRCHAAEKLAPRSTPSASPSRSGSYLNGGDGVLRDD